MTLYNLLDAYYHTLTIHSFPDDTNPQDICDKVVLYKGSQMLAVFRSHAERYLFMQACAPFATVGYITENIYCDAYDLRIMTAIIGDERHALKVPNLYCATQYDALLVYDDLHPFALEYLKHRIRSIG